MAGIFVWIFLIMAANFAPSGGFFAGLPGFSSTICHYGGRAYSPGQKFHPDVCTSCRCPWQGGQVTCTVKDCREESECLRHAKVTSRRRDSCCPRCLEYGCRHTDGKVYKQGETISQDGCARCYCPLKGGQSTCEVKPCPPVLCVDFHLTPGSCCPTCPHGSNCQLGLTTIPAGAVVRIEGALCRCRLTRRGENFKMEAKCQRKLS